MGIDALDAEFILREHLYRPLPRTVHLVGRQTVHMNYSEADALMRRHGITPVQVPVTIDRQTSYAISAGGDFISDATFFGMLGVEVLRAIDHSDFEGADIILDLNQHVPEQLVGTVEFLYGGSVLDNIFDPATYLQNVARLLAPGGRVLDVNVMSFHLHPYTLLSPVWYLDYFALNGFDDCKVYLLHSSAITNVYTNAITHVYFLKADENDDMIADFGDAGLGSVLSSVVIAEKGKESTTARRPSQDQYRDRQEWDAFRAGLRRINASPRPVSTFVRPSAVELLRMPLRWSKSYLYIGALNGADSPPYYGILPKPSVQGIRIVEASYGLNLSGHLLPRAALLPLCRGNATEQLAAMLNGRNGAELTIDIAMLGDPAPGLGKDLTILYFYEDDPGKAIRHAYLPAEAHGRLLTIPALA